MAHDLSALAPTEVHPSAALAMQFIQKIEFKRLWMYQEIMASCALSGNRAAEVCLGTLNRVLQNEPVSDRYIMGLAWYILELENLT